MSGIQGLIGKLKKVKNEVLQDNEGWFRQGKFTPSNFWNTAPAKGLTGIQRLTQKAENIPEVKVPKFDFKSSNKIVDSVLNIPQFVANLPSNIIEGAINLPGNYTKGIARTGNYLGSVVRGDQLFSPFQLATNVAPTAKAILDVATMRTGSNAVKNLGNQSLKQAVLSNAIPGAKLGAGFGGLDALEKSRNQTFKQSLPSIALNTAIGGVAGGVIGGGVGALGYGAKKLFTDFNPQSTAQKPISKVKEPTQLEINDSRASSEVPIKPFTYDKNAYNPISDNAKAVAKEIFGDNRIPTSERGIGSAAKQRIDDNPLLVSQELMNHINKIDVKKKVNIVDYVKTPEGVLKKLGLNNEMEMLRKAQDNYFKEIKNEIGRVSAWEKRVPGAESSKRIFSYLDGDDIKLDVNELQVAGEIKTYLNKWADRLDLPKENRISNYITHIFEKGDIEADFNPDIAKMIDNKVSGSVYDPFLQKRTNTKGYVTDVWKALDAYIKRATRKANYDPALDRVSVAADKLDLESYKYIQKYISGVNMRPTETDNLVDNAIKSTIGYKFGSRPTAYITGKTRKTMSRAMLGLNPGSALRNLSQGANTYAELGGKYTLKGYMSLFNKNNIKELYDNGILDEGLVQDRALHAVKPLMEKLDPIIYSLFESAEKINRGSAYFGAKQKGLAAGMADDAAVDFAKRIVRKTQFSFSKIDTPVALQSDILKTALQFGTYNLKQAEFLLGLIKEKNIGGIVRYTASAMVFVNTIGKLFGMGYEELIPYLGGFKPPLIQLGENVKSGVTNLKNGKIGQGVESFMKTGAMLIPAGSQLKKTYQGVKSINQGYSETPSGLVRYPVEQTPVNYLRGILFGQYNLPEGQQYFKEDNRPLSAKQSALFKQATDKNSYYDQVLSDREDNAEIKKAKEDLKASNQLYSKVGETYLYKAQQFDTSTGGYKTVVKSIDTTKTAPELKLTGQAELDKKIISAYNSELTSQINDIFQLNRLGQISDLKANEMISALKTKKYSSSKGSKRKLAKPPKMKTIKLSKLPKIKKLKIGVASTIKAKNIKYKQPKVLTVTDLKKSLQKMLQANSKVRINSSLG